MKKARSKSLIGAQFSLFDPGINTEAGQTPVNTITIGGALHVMNSEYVKEQTKQLRSITDEKAQQEFKRKHLPFVTFGGVFSYRRANGLIHLSGLQCFDIDHLNGEEEVNRVKMLLWKDPHFETQLVFTSPRGNGVKWVIKIDFSRGDYATWYRAVLNYLYNDLGIEADKAPANVASACFLCHDESVLFNDEEYNQQPFIKYETNSIF